MTHHPDKAREAAADYAMLQARIDVLTDKRGPDECWPWKGQTRDTSFKGERRACMTVGRKVPHVARIILEIRIGRPLTTHEWGLHHCDNQLCVNPKHLYLGTRQDNIRDMVNRRRTVAKLRDEDVLEIVRRRKSGESVNALSREYKVDRATIWAILSGASWSYLTGIPKLYRKPIVRKQKRGHGNRRNQISGDTCRASGH